MTYFVFDNTFARELPQAYVPQPPAPARSPRLLFFNAALADELGLDRAALDSPEGAAIFAGSQVPDGAQPLAQVYAGHQFGGFSPQLGDGRALLLGEVVDRHGKRRDIALKGSGRTPFSRGGDGKAAVGPMLREALVSESVHALGIPTTRALAVAGTGEPVLRDRRLPGAVLTRVAASHLRVGTLQYFAAQRRLDVLRQVADYAIARHDPSLGGESDGRPERYLALLEAVARRQASLIARWMNAGFLHGVMNTDNMTLSGETIDYGPCAFIEAYDPRAVFSSIDTAGRYAFGNQPLIARWNLARLAEALLPLIAESDDDETIRRAVDAVMPVIDAFPGWYDAHWRDGQRAKLGLAGPGSAETAALADDWLALLHANAVDFTLAWRALSVAAGGDESALRARVGDSRALDAWLARWRAACAAEDAAGIGEPARRSQRMLAINPRIIARNQQVEEALAAASDDDDLGSFDRLMAAVRRPYDDDPALAPYAEPAPAAVTARYQTFCGT